MFADEIDMTALPAVLVPPVRLEPYCCPAASLCKASCRARPLGSWALSAVYTVRLASGAETLRPLVVQAVSTTLARLMVVAGNLYPYVTTTGSIAPPRQGVYVVTAKYPTMVEGHRRLPDGVVCEEVTPVAVPVNLDEQDAQADLATAKTRPGGEWNVACKEAANSLMTDDVLVDLNFQPFSVDEV
jgi:hypothetical protein